MLNDILSKLPPQAANPALLIGHETGDDAAVFKINDEQAVVATTDFFMPIVDDPYDYGRIAATNALSDVYAVGGTPILALAIAAMPMHQMSPDTIQKILSGGAQVCANAGVPVAGGHTIDAVEPIYGLAVVGLVHPDRIKRNCEAQEGDDLILGKALGVGILGAAMNKDELDPEGYRQMVETATKLNAVRAELSKLPGFHALTDVTGFGLIGHLLEICLGSNLAGAVNWNDLPILPAARDYAERGYNTGAAGRNWQSFGPAATLPVGISDWQKNLLTDPHTSGGLMRSCTRELTGDVLNIFNTNGFADATKIGQMQDGRPHVTVTL